MDAIPEGPKKRARQFDVSARFLSHGPECPQVQRRHRALADALARHGVCLPAPGRPEARLLCDLEGQPLLAFLPSRDAGSAARASTTAALEQRLRQGHDLALGIGHPVPHVLPGVGPGHLTSIPGRLAPPLRQAFAAHRRGDIGAAAMLDLASKEAVRDLSPKALQTLALSRLFTNDWYSDRDRQLVDVEERCWPLNAEATFPDRRTLLLSLSAMQCFHGLAPLFRIPEDAGPSWDAPLDPMLSAKLLGIATTGRKDDAIRVVRTLIEEDPTLSLRRLLERFPHRLDWLDAPPPRRVEQVPDTARVLKPAQVFNPTQVSKPAQVSTSVQTESHPSVDDPGPGRAEGPKKRKGLRRLIAGIGRLAARCRAAITGKSGPKDRTGQGAPGDAARRDRPTQRDRPGAGS